ncbi:glutathione reductase [Salmonella enterica subsp. enterica]|uniref:Glutathione reductase n=1 Tax=Salmonella enterica I TaxID=59201 RepID=A0A379W161_SALET|nr:glutathione reductase [Salmonella enterica subsp. enterica]
MNWLALSTRWGAKTHLFVRKHAPLRSFDPMISETLVEVMNAEGPQLHTHAVPKAVVKNATAV